VQKVLDDISLGGERLRMFYMSAAMAGKFVEATTQMDELIERLGPNPLRLASSDGSVQEEEGSP
jgi:F420-non-reducing hydrogenase iron-sulfur subunit